MTTKLMLRQFLFFCLCLTLYSCSAQNCRDIPSVFSSYQQAKNLIQKSSFAYSDKLNTSKSSWIRGASFYSCDNKTGFLIIATDKQEYTHQNLPIEIWNSFKSANSFGQFYNQNIKNRYQLKVRQ
jgi:hypothetical protein